MRKKLVLVTLSLATIFLVGCGTQLRLVFQSDLPTAIANRAEQNIGIATKLRDAGFIDDEYYKKLKKQINKVSNEISSAAEAYNGKDDKAAREGTNRYINAASYVHLRRPDWGQIEDDNGTTDFRALTENTLKDPPYYMVKKIPEGAKEDQESMGAYALGNHIYGQLKDNGKGTRNMAVAWKKIEFKDKNKIEPINFFAGQEDLIKDMNKRFRAEIYVLDSSLIQNSSKSVDEIFAAIEAAKKKGDLSGVSQYFTQLKDKNGKAVHLLPDDFKIVRNSRDNTSISKNIPGYDMVVKQELWYGYIDKETGEVVRYPRTEEVASFKFTEFDTEAFDKLVEIAGISESAYYFQKLNDISNSGSTYKAFLMEYPVSVIGDFNISTNKQYCTAEFRDSSGIGINIGTGKLLSYKKKDGKWTKESTVVNSDEMYLTTDFAKSASKGDVSSFVTKGYHEDEIKVYEKNSSGKYTKSLKVDVVLPRIIMRDYLEATWAPGSTSYNENLVVFGRKIRFRTDKNAWKKDGNIKFNGTEVDNYTLKYKLTHSAEYCAKFIDKEGKESKTSGKIFAYDICDVEKLAKGDDSTSTTSDNNSENNSNNNNSSNRNTNRRAPASSASTVDNSGQTTNSNSEKGWKKYTSAHFPEAGTEGFVKECVAEDKDEEPEQKELRQDTTVSKIKASCLFPGKYIGSCDKDNTGTTIQRFYCVVTTKGMFDSALFSDWVNSTEEKASFDWWTKFLDKNGYTYKIDHNGLNNYVKDNYSFELGQNDIVILDLDTVNKIQEIYDEEDVVNRNSFLRTVFVIIGVFLIAYSVLLMVAWAVDTNADIGLNLLTKMTFGNWVAIKYEDDIPRTKTHNYKYIVGKQMFWRCIIIIAIGVALMRISVTQVILVLIRMFGAFASYIEEIVRGVYR